MEDVDKTQDEEEIVTEEQHDNAQEEVEEKDWKAEALKNKAIADRLKKKLSQPQTINNPKPEHDDDLVKTVKNLETIELKRQFGFENNLSPAETDFIFKISNGKPSKEILEDPFVKGGLDSYRAKQRIENNTPGSSSRSSVFADKNFAELDENDRKKAFEAAAKKVVRK